MFSTSDLFAITMNPLQVIITLIIGLLVGLYMGGISGGLISAILLKIPGTPSSISTVLTAAPWRKRVRRAVPWALVFWPPPWVLSLVSSR